MLLGTVSICTTIEPLPVHALSLLLCIVGCLWSVLLAVVCWSQRACHQHL